MAEIIVARLKASSLVEVLVALSLVIITFTSGALVIGKVARASGTINGVSARYSLYSYFTMLRENRKYYDHDFIAENGHEVQIKVEKLIGIEHTYKVHIKVEAGIQNTAEHTFIEYYAE